MKKTRKSKITNSNQTGADEADIGVNQANLQAWLLGAMLSRYAAAAAHQKTHSAASWFEKAKLTAEKMNLEIKPLPALGENPAENYPLVAGYFLHGEGIRLAAKLNEAYGAPVSEYFMIIVKCYLLLLMYRPDATGRALAESALTRALSQKHLTVIPEKYFSQLISAVERGVERELLEAVTEDFYTAISDFLFERFRREGSPQETETMNSVKNAFTILYFLASVDGQIDERELQVIIDFVKRQHGQANFDARRTVSDLTTLTGVDRIEEYDRALSDFKKSSTVRDRARMLDYAVKSAAANGGITEVEKAFFVDLAHIWEIDLQASLKKPGVIFAPRVPATRAAVQTITVLQTDSGISWVNTPAAQAAPAAGISKKVNRAYFFAWTLGSALSLYALNAASLNHSAANGYFEQARIPALGVGVYINPLTGITNDLAANQAILLDYFLKDEGVRLSAEMDAKCEAPVSDYFQIIVKTYILLMMYSPAEKSEAETNIEEIISLTQRTVLPRIDGLLLRSAIQQGESREKLKLLVASVDATLRKHLQLRINA